jgi:hypothetical protein
MNMKPQQVQKEAQDLMSHIANKILEATTLIENVKKSFKTKDIGQKNEDIRELKEILQNIMTRSDELYKNLDKLREATREKPWFDRSIVENKMEEIDKLRQATRSLSEFLTPPPSEEDLHGGGFNELLDMMNDIIEAANHIKIDDEELSELFEGRIPSPSKDKNAL